MLAHAKFLDVLVGATSTLRVAQVLVPGSGDADGLNPVVYGGQDVIG